MAHAVAEASAAVVLEVAHAVASQAEEASAVAHSVADQAVVLEEVIIMLPHPLIITDLITTITARFSGDPDAVFMLAVVLAVDALP